MDQAFVDRVLWHIVDGTKKHGKITRSWLMNRSKGIAQLLTLAVEQLEREGKVTQWYDGNDGTGSHRLCYRSNDGVLARKPKSGRKRKTVKAVRGIGLRISDDLYQQIERAANERGASLNAEVRRRLEASFGVNSTR